LGRNALSVAFSPDGRRIVTCDYELVRLWDAETLQLIEASLQGHSGSVTSVAFSPDGTRIVSGSYDKTLRFWDAETLQPIGEPLQGHTADVKSVAFSPDGHYIVSGSDDETLRLWDAKTLQPIGEPLEGHSISAKPFIISIRPPGVTSVAFSLDGRLIVSGGWDKTVRLWNTETLQPIGAPLKGHMDSVISVIFSPDGRYIVSGGKDGTLRLWDVGTGRQIGVIPLGSEREWAHSVAVAPDGRHIVSGHIDGSIRLWPSPKAWPDELCKKLTHNMSRKEWNEWVSPEIGYTCQCPGLPIAPDDPMSGPPQEICHANNKISAIAAR
jgi:WD40 repeat protein